MKYLNLLFVAVSEVMTEVAASRNPVKLRFGCTWFEITKKGTCISLCIYTWSMVSGEIALGYFIYIEIKRCGWFKSVFL